MNDARDTGLPPIQFSLGALLAFVLASGAWFMLLTTIHVPTSVVLSTALVSLLTGLLAHLRNARAMVIMMALFLTVVMVSHLGLDHAAFIKSSERKKRMTALRAIESKLDIYKYLTKDWPPTEQLEVRSDTALYHALFKTKFSTPNGVGTIGMTTIERFANGDRLEGALGHRLMWVRTQYNYMLIDTGPDGVPRGTLGKDGVFVQGYTDTNNDSIDDGADDLFIVPYGTSRY